MSGWGLRLTAVTVSLGIFACGSGDGSTNDDGQAIAGGKATHEYPEAVTLSGKTTGADCTGTLIAPKVVLTAAHCLFGNTEWDVATEAGANRQAQVGRSSKIFDAENAKGLSADRHDVGLIFLDEPIVLSSYSAFARAPLPANAAVSAVGRVINNAMSGAFFTRDTKVNDGKAVGWPLDYIGSSLLESGDSGGPLYAAGTHEVVAVNSGKSQQKSYYARVDLVADQIQAEIDAHGGTDPGVVQAAATADNLTSGNFGALAIAVRGSTVTGAVREGDCEFTVAGQRDSDATIDLALLTPTTKKTAQLTVRDGSTITFTTADMPAECGSLFKLDKVAQGITLTRGGAPIADEVSAFRTVKADAAAFRATPDKSAAPTQASVARGDTVEELGDNDSSTGFVKVRFSADASTTTTGYLSVDDLVPLGFDAQGI